MAILTSSWCFAVQESSFTAVVRRIRVTAAAMTSSRPIAAEVDDSVAFVSARSDLSFVYVPNFFRDN